MMSIRTVVKSVTNITKT